MTHLWPLPPLPNLEKGPNGLVSEIKILSATLERDKPLEMWTAATIAS